MQTWVLITILFLTSANAGAAAAQARAGVPVTGVAADPTGAVLPGAQVQLAPPGGGAEQTTTTDQAGAFRFDQVTPGRYEIRVTFEGFHPTTVRLNVTGRPPGPVRVILPLAAITQEVTVGSAAEVRTDPGSNLDAPSVDAAAIENLPVFDQDILGTMARFLDSTAIGTNGPTLLVNGVEVNKLMVSASAIQQIKINRDPYSAEYPRPGHGRIEVVLKPGSQEYHGTGNLIFRDSAFDERNAFAAVKPPEQRRIFEGFLGGPLGRSKNTSFTLSLKDDADDTQAIVFARDAAGAVQENVAAPYRNLLAAATLHHQQSQNTTMSLTFSYEDETQHHQDVGGVTLPSAGTNWRSLEHKLTYTQQTIFTPKLLNQIRLQVGQELEPTTSVNPGRKVVVLDAFTGGGAQGDQLRTEHRLTLTEMLTWSSGRHTVKWGMNIPDLSRRRFDDNTNTGGTFYFSNLGDYVAGRPYAFIQQVGNGHVAFLEKVIGFFVQDEIRVGPRLSASLGLRYDWQNYFHDDNNIGPRGSFAFAPSADGKSVIRGGAGVFYDRTGPRPIQDLLRYDGVRQRRYVVTNPGYPDPFGAGQSLATEPPSVVQVAPGVQLPMTLGYSVSYERQLAKATSASITYTGTRGLDQFRSRDINAPTPPLYAARPDPTRGVVREIESRGELAGNSVQLTLRGRVTRLVNASAQYTLSETKNNTSGINWMPPNSYDLSLEYARADFDRRHRFDLLGTVNPGSWLNLGIALALYSGRPYSLTTGRDGFNTGIANARPAGIPRNSLDGPGYADLDLRWSRDLFSTRTKNASALTFGIDVFNVLNRVNATEYIGTLTSPFFGQAITAKPPRQLQFSVRAKF
jgi:outer membrane receptor protein involved in Fe transport